MRATHRKGESVHFHHIRGGFVHIVRLEDKVSQTIKNRTVFVNFNALQKMIAPADHGIRTRIDTAVGILLQIVVRLILRQGFELMGMDRHKRKRVVTLGATDFTLCALHIYFIDTGNAAGLLRDTEFHHTIGECTVLKIAVAVSLLQVFLGIDHRLLCKIFNICHLLCGHEAFINSAQTVYARTCRDAIVGVTGTSGAAVREASG